MLRNLFFVLSFVFISIEAQAQVSARPCPHSCATEGIPKHMCQDWRRGNICYVNRVAPHTNRNGYNHGNYGYGNYGNGNYGNYGNGNYGSNVNFPNTRGQVSSGRCPYSCRTIGAAKSRCKDWAQGGVCYVQTF